LLETDLLADKIFMQLEDIIENHKGESIEDEALLKARCFFCMKAGPIHQGRNQLQKNLSFLMKIF
jgi:hypothetical protein